MLKFSQNDANFTTNTRMGDKSLEQSPIAYKYLTIQLCRLANVESNPTHEIDTHLI